MVLGGSGAGSEGDPCDSWWPGVWGPENDATPARGSSVTFASPTPAVSSKDANDPEGIPRT